MFFCWTWGGRHVVHPNLFEKQLEDESLAEVDNASSDLAQIPAITVAIKSELKFFYLKTCFFTRKPNFQPFFFFLPMITYYGLKKIKKPSQKPKSTWNHKSTRTQICFLKNFKGKKKKNFIWTSLIKRNNLTKISFILVV